MSFLNVRTRKFLAGLIAVTVLMSLCACSRVEETEETKKPSNATDSTERIIYDKADFFSVINYYLKFIERSSYDSQGAVREYVHYEQDWLREMALEQDDPTISCEILEVKKLNDQLWVIKVFATSMSRPEGFVFHNFVGVIDGELFVMVNHYNVPAKLKEGLDLSEYHKEGMYE